MRIFRRRIHRRKYRLNVLDEDNFTNVAKLDDYLDSQGNFDKYIAVVRGTRQFLEQKSEYPSKEELTDIILKKLLKDGIELWDYLSQRHYPVRDKDKYEKKVHNFAEIIVHEAQSTI